MHSVTFSPDGNILVSDNYNEIILWDLDINQPISFPLSGHSGAVNSVAFSPEGIRIEIDQQLICWPIDLSTESLSPAPQR